MATNHIYYVARLRAKLEAGNLEIYAFSFGERHAGCWCLSVVYFIVLGGEEQVSACKSGLLPILCYF